MLEFFTVAYYTDRLGTLKEKENKQINNLFNDEEISRSLINKNINIDALNLVAGIIVLVVAIWAAKLAYTCNIKRSDVSQVIAVLFAFFFPGFYLIYYFVWHTFLGNKC